MGRSSAIDQGTRGYFNAIRSKEEKRGRHFDCAEMREFNNFILEVELEDIPLLGRKFTWYRPDETAMSKLDRFVLSTKFLTNFPEVTQRGLCRDLSDHCPILLKNSVVDWRPKPFKSFDCWLNHEGYYELM